MELFFRAVGASVVFGGFTSLALISAWLSPAGILLAR